MGKGVNSLLNYQKVDEDGVWALTSRAAIHGALDTITTLQARVDELDAENMVMRTALEWVCENHQAHRGNIYGVAYKALKDITIGPTK